MLVMQEAVDLARRTVSDAAVRADLIRRGVLKAKVAKTGDDLYLVGYRWAWERYLIASRVLEPTEDAIYVGPGAIVARALRIKTLALALVADLVTGLGRRFALPLLKSNGFYSCLKVDARNAP